MDNDKQFGNFLAKIRMRSGFKSQRQLAIEANISPATLSRIEAGVQKPQPETLLAISKFLKDVSYEDLLKAAGYLEEREKAVDEFLKSVFSEPPQSISETDIPKTQKEFAQSLINRIMSKAPNKDVELVPIPILGTIKAGYDLYAEQNIDGYSIMPKHEVSDGEYFYLKVKGDSMNGDRIYDGDRVLVRKQNYVDDTDDIAVVIINGDEATLKRVIPLGSDMVALTPSNPNYPVKACHIDDIRILGIVMKVEFDYKKR